MALRAGLLTLLLVSYAFLLQAEAPSREGRVTAVSAEVRLEPAPDGRILFQLKRGTLLRIIEETGEWYLIEAPGKRIGYLRLDMMEVLTPAPPPTPAPTPVPSAAPPTTTLPADPVPPVLVHDTLICAPAGRPVRVQVQVTARADVQRARVYFKAHQRPDWYYVDLKPGPAPRYEGLLPAPLPETRSIDYYVYALDARMLTARTDSATARVTADCVSADPSLTAGSGLVVVGGTQEGQAPVPPGFSKKDVVVFVTAAGATLTGEALERAVGGAPAAAQAAPASGASSKKSGSKTLLIVAGGGAAVAGVAVAASGGGSGQSAVATTSPATQPPVTTPATTQPPVTSPPTTTQPPVTVPPVTTPPTTTPNPPPTTSARPPRLAAPHNVSLSDGQTVGISVSNVGGSNLEISDVSVTPSDFFEVVEDGCTRRGVAPQGGCQVAVHCDQGGFGPQSGALSLSSNDPSQPTFVVNLRCE